MPGIPMSKAVGTAQPAASSTPASQRATSCPALDRGVAQPAKRKTKYAKLKGKAAAIREERNLADRMFCAKKNNIFSEAQLADLATEQNIGWQESRVNNHAKQEEDSLQQSSQHTCSGMETSVAATHVFSNPTLCLLMDELGWLEVRQWMWVGMSCRDTYTWAGRCWHPISRPLDPNNIRRARHFLVILMEGREIPGWPAGISKLILAPPGVHRFLLSHNSASQRIAF